MDEEASYLADDPGFTFEEFAGRIKSNEQGMPDPGLAAQYFDVDVDAWEEADLQARPWIAPGYLLRGAVTALIGPGAAGKSSLMIAWATALALGIGFNRFRPEAPCRVLLLNTEDKRDEQRLRLTAALRRLGRSPADLQGQIMRVAPKRFGPLFGMTDDRLVAELPAMQGLRHLIEMHEPDVVMLDPLIDLHAVSENANTEMREVMSLLRAVATERNIAVLVAHHTHKGAINPGDSDAARGASAIRDLARIALTVLPMSEEDAKAFNITADHRKYFFRVDDAKQNYAVLGETSWFERMPVSFGYRKDTFAAESWSPPVDVLTPEIRRSIEEGIASGTRDGPWSPKLDKADRSFRHLCLQHGIVTSQGQHGLLKDLYAAGYSARTFRRRSNSAKAQGIRTPDGRPNASWLDSEEITEDE